MVKKLFLAFLAFSLVITFTGCEEFTDWLLGGTTGVEGKLKLADDNVDEDLDDTKVYLYDNSDFEDSHEEKTSADEDEDDETKATFEFEDIDENDYYLLAWKDLDDDDEISYGDLVGIYNGKYGEDEPEEIEVKEGEMSDVGTIKMYEYEGGGVGKVESISVSGSFTCEVSSYFYLEVCFSLDSDLLTDGDNYWDYAELGYTSGSSFNETFSVPSEYQEGCYVIFVVDGCYDADDDGYDDDLIYGFYGDDGTDTYIALPLQETYTGITMNVIWYVKDGCGGALSTLNRNKRSRLDSE